MPGYYTSLNIEELFATLSKSHVASAMSYFKDNPAIKYSRKHSKIPCSFICTNKGLFAISNKVVGTGSCGKVKIAKNMHTGEIAAVKIQLLILNNTDDYSNSGLHEELYVLDQLKQLHATAYRWWNNTAWQQLTNSDLGWKNKHETKKKYKSIKYNCKFYIFSDFFHGITLFEYFDKYAATTEKTLQIFIKVLEKLAVLHGLNIVHGDLSFNNILIDKTPDGEIEINLIDFGSSGKLQNGVKMYRILDYFFTKTRYVPPECDYKKVSTKIIPELQKHQHRSYFSHEMLKAITFWASNGYGFIGINSDLYSVGWCLHSLASVKNNPILLELKKHTYIMDPFYRKPLCFIKAKYQEELQQITRNQSVSTLLWQYRIHNAFTQNSNGLSSEPAMQIIADDDALNFNSPRNSILNQASSSNGLSSDRLEDLENLTLQDFVASSPKPKMHP